jgi:hypothetical protein
LDVAVGLGSSQAEDAEDEEDDDPSRLMKLLGSSSKRFPMQVKLKFKGSNGEIYEKD